VSWVPFELHPEAPLEGIPLEAYFGSSRSERIREHLRSVAAQVGLSMKQRDVIINSRRALAAAEFAREHGRFEDMHRALFKAHWEGSAKLEDVDDLVEIGIGLGLDGDELRRAITEGRYESLIDESRQEAESIGINAIPAHVFGRRYLVVGAQPYEAFKEVLDRLQRETSPESTF
jgi:predicted DsbA family dithiol-disulfide isomerase